MPRVAALAVAVMAVALTSVVVAQTGCQDPTGTYDLSSIAGQDYMMTATDYKYVLSVCGVVSNDPTCKQNGGALCQYTTATPPVYRHVLSDWGTNGDWNDCPAATCPNGGVQVHFSNGDVCNNVPRDVTFIFKCPGAGEQSSTAYTITNPPNSCSYTLLMTNSVGCGGSSGGGGGGKGGLSGGSVFLIIFFVVVPVYIVAGCVWKRQRQGAAGMEACPNIDFWRQLPGLVGDGFKFTWRKCLGLCGKGDATYEGMS